MEQSDRVFGLCPVCGHGHIIKTNRDYVCTNRLKPSSEHGEVLKIDNHHALTMVLIG